jgi:hypothetical protein
MKTTPFSELPLNKLSYLKTKQAEYVFTVGDSAMHLAEARC